MKKFALSNGIIYYEVSAKETYLLGGCGVCDSCGVVHKKGYLIPVLNSWYCTNCFTEFKETSMYYPEDAPIERKRAEYYESIITLEKQAVKEIEANAFEQICSVVLTIILFGGTHMDNDGYKKLICEMLEQIDNKTVLKKLYELMKYLYIKASRQLAFN